MASDLDLIPNKRAAGRVFADGLALANGVAITALVAMAGLIRLRLRILSTAGGTLKLEFVRPDCVTVYAANQPGTVAVVANTENKLDVDPVFDGLVKVTFTPSADGVLTYLDISGASAGV